ncbi:MAG: molybdopterin-dependent oxidoreductase [Chloroflexi bacterium]|nr:molybdopterin-dependent oxidoreductase [Chloroflexota bacterium]
MSPESDGVGAQASPPRLSPLGGLTVGLLAGGVMALSMVAVRLGAGAPTTADLLADTLTRLMPPALFDFLLERLRFVAKPLLFAGVLAAQVGLAGGLGVLYSRYAHRWPFRVTQPWLRGLLLTGVVWLVTVGLLTPLLGGGFLGLALPGNPPTYVLAQALVAGALALPLAHLHRLALGRRGLAYDAGRRSVLQWAVSLAVLAGAGGLAFRAILRGGAAIAPSRPSRTEGALPPEVTPNHLFYEVSKNIVNPRVDVATWRLAVGGDVGNPYALTYEELVALPWKEEYVTLTCVSNPVGGDLISTALWRGVPLRLLLERAQLPTSAQRIAFYAADGYDDSVPLEYAMKEQTLVAYHMNGEPLPHDHGFPARIILPGLYGMENVKWLTRIEPVPAAFRGYWQERGWADTAVIKTTSRIHLPEDGASAPLAQTLVGGVAFAGARTVRAVEVSTDGGYTWQPAELRKALSPFTWVLWTTTWLPPSEKAYTLAVRATDGAGEVQTAQVKTSLPDGATGHHRVVVVIRGQAP